MSHGALDYVRRGTAFYGKPTDVHPFLCSRPGQPFEYTVNEMEGVCSQLGFECLNAKDRTGNIRPFVIFPFQHAVRGGKFSPVFDQLHDSCKVLPNGYAASYNDFQDAAEYRKVVGKVSYEQSTIAVEELTLSAGLSSVPPCYYILAQVPKSALVVYDYFTLMRATFILIKLIFHNHMKRG
ncbi:hypothetical protein ANCCAN_04728 [Ancylostoma caninum]|uniref:Uncharacterized protein n=1 Tax=Ancylostoma caninum TaxID=29170 RepID=A0A368H1K0_ANCCA|nr:hypothetical protein ANCCAN_04728 [Ancylostoma caninum]